MAKKILYPTARDKKKVRVRKKIRGTDQIPRVCVFRSQKYTYAQLISDESGVVYGGFSTKHSIADGKSSSSVESAKLVGQKMAELIKEKNFEKVVFDRNSYLYHGRVAAIAEGLRESGVKV